MKRKAELGVKIYVVVYKEVNIICHPCKVYDQLANIFSGYPNDVHALCANKGMDIIPQRIAV